MNLDKSIGDILVEEKLISRDLLEQILSERNDTTRPLGDLLVEQGRISVKQKLRCVGLQMGIPFADLAHMELHDDVAKMIPHAVALRLLAVPIERTDFTASVAMCNPLDLAAIDELSAAMQLDVDPLIATEEDIRDAIFRCYGAYDDLGEIIGEAVKGIDAEQFLVDAPAVEEDEEQVNVIELKEVADGAPVIKLANALLTRAITMRASDIHIEPMQRRVRVRFRVDGLLQEVMSVPRDLQHPLVSRIKIMGALDIAERRAPQDGRCTLVSHQGAFDFRVSTYPCAFGENVVIRILDKGQATMSLEALGFEPRELGLLRQCAEEPQGFIMVSGPTGSGKTTTLYAVLNHLNSIVRNIITIEDPVEYQIDGIVQGNVNPKAGVTFATGLRAVLRQDPDVILIGEIRDRDTADIAIESALTGHMVLSTLHAKDAASAIVRLHDIGIEPFLIANSLSLSIAQRLVRVNCPKCSVPVDPSDQFREELDLPQNGTYLKGEGCEYCNNAGYRGRQGLYELLPVTADVRKIVQSGATTDQIREVAHAAGMRTLRHDGASKVAQGLTTPEEVLRCSAEA